MSDVALFSADRFYRSQFGTGQASYTVFQKDGVTYADPGYPGGTPYSGTEPGLVIRNAFTALNILGGGTVELKGPTNFVCNSKATVIHGVAGQNDACVILYDNTRLVIDKGVVLSQANGLNANVIVANEDFYSGFGTNTNIEIDCLGWIDANAANQVYPTPGPNNIFFSCCCAIYNCDTVYVRGKGRNYNNYGAFVFGGNQHAEYPYLYGKTGVTLANSINNFAATWITSSPTDTTHAGSIIGENPGIGLMLEDFASAQIDSVFAKASPLSTTGNAVQMSNPKKCQIGKIKGLGLGRTLSFDAQNQALSSEIQIGEIWSDSSNYEGVLISNSGASSNQDLKFQIGRAIIKNSQQIIGGFRVTQYASGIQVGLLRCFDDQGTKTQTYGIVFDTNAGIVSVLGGDLTGNRDGTVSGTPNVASVLKNLRGYNPQGIAAITVTASPFTYTNNDNVSEYVTIDGGTITTVIKNAITLYSFGGTAARCGVWLEPGEAVIVTYTVAPTMNKDRK